MRLLGDIIVKNALKEKLSAGKAAFGTWIMTSGLDNAEIIANAGADAIMIDGEHGGMDIETAGRMISLIRATPTTPLLRVAWSEMSLIKRALDTGAGGIMIPMINTGEEAQKAVEMCKYPPVGIRGVGASRATLYASGAPKYADYIATANDEVLVILQIESYKAVENAEDIISVPGVDIVFIGLSDLSQSMGIPGQMNHPEVIEACKKVVACCMKHGVIPATVTWPGGIQQHLDQGFRLLLGGADSAILYQGVKALVTEFEDLAQ